MFVGLTIILIESWIKNIRVLLVSIDYHKYFELVSIIPFFSRFYIFFVLHYIFKTSQKD
jgi:hypothetical protein